MGVFDKIKDKVLGEEEEGSGGPKCCSCGEPESVNKFAGTCSNPECEVHGQKVCVVCADEDDDGSRICLYCEQKLT